MGSSIAFIHARGGSKRIPRKNIKMFHGKPLIAYPIETALQSGIFDKVIVSTDDQEITDIALQYGAQVPELRPDELANDTATTDQVFIHDIQQELKNNAFDYACCIYGTSVFLEQDYLTKALNTLGTDKNVHSVNSMTDYDFSIFRSLKQNDEGFISFLNPEYRTTRSQDLPDAYHDAAQFYFVNVQSYLKNPKVFSEGATKAVHIPAYKVVDIDTPDDWVRAEMAYKAIKG
jgi:pseudaminic acid cytidylyltransferase